MHTTNLNDCVCITPIMTQNCNMAIKYSNENCVVLSRKCRGNTCWHLRASDPFTSGKNVSFIFDYMKIRVDKCYI